MIILGLRVGRSKNKNTDYQGKETCAYKKDHISFLCDSTMSSALNICFLSVLLQRKRKRSYKKKNKYWKRKIFIYEISISCLRLILNLNFFFYVIDLTSTGSHDGFPVLTLDPFTKFWGQEFSFKIPQSLLRT